MYNVVSQKRLSYIYRKEIRTRNFRKVFSLSYDFLMYPYYRAVSGYKTDSVDIGIININNYKMIM